METYTTNAIQDVLRGQMAFCKFFAANDTGQTGTNQDGIYIPKDAFSILFDEPGFKGEIKDRFVVIKWQNDIVTKSRFVYYGQKTRDEYRITRFGRGFPFLKNEYTGALFVLVKLSDEDYSSYILNTEDDINQFLDSFGISPTETGHLIDVGLSKPKMEEQLVVQEFISRLTVDFPESAEMAAAARTIQDRLYNHAEFIRTDPDKKVIEWTKMEFALFRAVEQARYGAAIQGGFNNVDDFISMANMVLNRRKSRAGKSLEHHLKAIFDGNGIIYKAQAITEGNKKPDFLFPSQEAYHDICFPTEKLITLAAKTTCKDRWRQILPEADRLRDRPKYLCTLQQGISSAQMDEMQAEKVILVVPQEYIKKYPEDRRNRIWTLGKFIKFVREMEGL